jgi:hypothetical protein
MSIKYLHLLAVAAVVGCASSGTPGATRGDPNVLSAAEIAEHHADVNTAYDAVARLRPNWLAPHGPVSSNASSYATVFVDGQFAGDPSALRNIPAYHVGAIRYYDVTQAGARFGIRAGGGGAMEVTMQSPR